MSEKKETPTKDEKNSLKWLFSVPGIIIAFLIAGPLALILVYMSPELDKRTKIISTALIVITSIALLIATLSASKEIINYYRMIFGKTPMY